MQIGLRLPEKLLQMPNAHYWYKHLGLGPTPEAPDFLNTFNQRSGHKTDTIYREIDVEGEQQEPDPVDVPWELIAPRDVVISPNDSTVIVWNPMMPTERVKELYIAVKAKSGRPVSDMPGSSS